MRTFHAVIVSHSVKSVDTKHKANFTTLCPHNKLCLEMCTMFIVDFQLSSNVPTSHPPCLPPNIFSRPHRLHVFYEEPSSQHHPKTTQPRPSSQNQTVSPTTTTKQPQRRNQKRQKSNSRNCCVLMCSDVCQYFEIMCDDAYMH